MDEKTGRLKSIIFTGIFLFFSLSMKAEGIRLFTPTDGLSNSHISQIYQDSKGYIWIATENGLNKFNGYNFEVYLSVPDDSTSIQANYITGVLEDSRGLFWVATSNGLLQYDRTRNAFFRWKMGEIDKMKKDHYVCYIFEDRSHNMWISYLDRVVRLDANTLSPVVFNKQNSGIGNNALRCIFEDRHGNLWLGSENAGIFVFNPQNNTTKHFHHHPADPSGLNNNAVFSICEKTDGAIWVGTIGGGINVFDEQTQSFHALESDNIPMDNLINALLLDKNQTVWVGTDGAGIFRYDVHGNRTHFWEEVSSVYDLRKAKVHAIFQDKQGNIWVALHQKGVLFISASGNYFQNIGFNPFIVSKSIGTHCVISIVEDYQGNVWAGTDGDGLYRIQPSGNVDHFTSENTPGFQENVITALFEDRDHQLWIGTYLHGFFRYNSQTGKFDSHYRKTNPENSLNNNYITAFTQDDEGNLWVGTGGSGVSVYNAKTYQFKQYAQLSSNWVFDIVIDRNKEVWVSTSTGLNHLNKELDKFELFGTDNDNLIISNLMYVSHDDEKGNIWIGGYYGLYCFDKKTGKSTLITTADGLPDNMITGIERDEDNFLWISTGRGLCRYDPQTKECLNFYAENGIQSNEFRRGSHFKGKNNKMYFGGINGITTFYPSMIVFESPLLGLAFTGFQINNQPVSVGSDILEKSIDETTSIRLKYNQHNFTFSFAAMEFGRPLRVNYYTQMENFDTQWHLVNNTNRSATYTNLNPGSYVFKVQATIDGINILQKNMQVVILPPWWSSIPAKILYSMLVVFSLYSIYAFLSYRALKRQRILELHRAELEQTVKERTHELVVAKEKAEESERLKSAFLANMSHEIRTPLNGIIGILQLMNAEELSPADRQEYLRIINHSTTQLAGIINDIIDLSKIEAKLMTFAPVPVDLNKLMHELWVFFNTYLQTINKKHILLILDNSEFIDECVIYIDTLRLNQVINNLLSNAVKFTHGGYICFGYRKSEPGVLEFVVRDSGIGMRNDQLEVIFERFRQADMSHDRRRIYGGTGLGLTISRSLVQMAGGKMWVESAEGVGSSFYFTIPFLPVVPEDIHIFESTNNQSDENKPFAGKSILLVEPYYMNFTYYEKLISATGATVLKAENLQQCYDIMTLHHQTNMVIIDAATFDDEDLNMISRIKNEHDKLPIALIFSGKKAKYASFLRNNLCNTTIQAPAKYTDLLKIMREYARP